MANAEQIRIWNEVNPPRLFAIREPSDRALAPYGEAALDALKPAPGDHALDVGCGFGAATLDLARRVGPSGSVLGVDVSEPCLAAARKDSAAFPWVRYLRADAQTQAFEQQFDICFSRFGVMFFDDPAAAFANLRRTLRPGGRLGVVVWTDAASCGWMQMPLRVVRLHLPVTLAPPGAPGPFGLADRGELARILESAGFTQVRIESLDIPYFAGATADDAAAFLLQLGPASSALREAGEAGDRLRPRLAADLRSALAPWLGRRGVELPSPALLATATAG